MVGPLLLATLIVSCTSSADPSTTSQRTATTQPEATTEPGPSTTAPLESTTERLKALGGEPCPDSDFTCMTLTVPLDHFGDGTETTDVVFAVLPANGEREGVFVTATGGPGTAGISYADSYTSVLVPEFTEKFDIVFFDQRGVGMSGHLTCPEASVALYRIPSRTALGFDQVGLKAAAEQYATECLAEAGESPLWPYLSTDQVIEDIEAFRKTMGYESMIFFGESYGTQVVQTYAAAHGDRVERMVIDGVVDLTLSGLEFFADQATAFTNTLESSFAACADDPACISDFDGRSPGDEYDRLTALLIEEPLSTDFPLPDGTASSRSLDLGALEYLAAGQMYSETDRAILLRALAASATRDDIVPLLRIFYQAMVLDPADETIIEDPTWSDAIYYGVDCLDYHYPGDTPAERTQAFFDNADGFETQRLGNVAVEELPCAFWPHTPSSEERPAPLVAEGIPTLVLGATADPATPYQQGIAVLGRLAEGYEISQQGGPHVIWGRGNECPDLEVDAFILEGTPPSQTECEGYVVDYYPPLFAESISDYDDMLTFLAAIEDEVTYLPEYWYWDGYEETAAGCSNGGILTMGPTDAGYSFDFDGCAFAADAPITGHAEYDAGNDVFTMEDISVGPEDCVFSYERSGENYDVADKCDAYFQEG